MSWPTSSGKPDEPLPLLRDRKFVDIDRDNFNEVLKGTKPRLAFRVDNKLTDDDTKLGIELRFTNMDDFEPERVVQQVEPLRKLLEIRRELKGLLAKTDGNDRLNERCRRSSATRNCCSRLRQEAGLGDLGDEGEKPAEEGVQWLKAR